jgi:hypothetical protein
VSTPTTISIDGIDYVRKDSVTTQNITGDVKIIILPNGFVFIGRFSKDASGICTLRNAYNIRRFGTTTGLGQLAKEGPLPETKLDPMNGEVTFDWMKVIATIDCESSKFPKI